MPYHVLRTVAPGPLDMGCDMWACSEGAHVTPYKGQETWLLVGYVGAVPQYQANPGGRVLPRKLATQHAAARGYRAVFRDAVKEPRARVDASGGGLDLETIAGGIWWLAVFGIAFAGC